MLLRINRLHKRMRKQAGITIIEIVVIVAIGIGLAWFARGPLRTSVTAWTNNVSTWTTTAHQ